MSEKQIIEALLFASSEPLPIKRIQAIVKIDQKRIRSLIEELSQEYDGRAFKLEEIGGGYLLRSMPAYNSYIKQLVPTRKERLSQAALEVLSIIAFKKGITRSEIEAIRGVDCSNMIHSLIEKELIEMTGKLEVPGRPAVYGVTNRFLLHFGLNDIHEISAQNS